MNKHWQTVVFVDLDQTVIEGPFHSVVFPTVFRELAAKSGLSMSEIRHLTFEENLRRQRCESIEPTMAMDWDDIVKSVAEKLGLKGEMDDIAKIVSSHARPPFSSVCNNAFEVLQHLSQPQRAVVAATKGLRKYQMPILEGLGLASLFLEVLTPDSHQSLKTSKAFYGDWPQDSQLQISVGDHYIDDVVSPTKFGFKTIWKTEKQENIKNHSPIARSEVFKYSKEQAIHPTAIIFSLDELNETVDIIERMSLL